MGTHAYQGTAHADPYLNFRFSTNHSWKGICLKFSSLVWNTCRQFWVFTVFWSSGFFRDFLKIPRIRDFFESRDFYPRDSGFFLNFGIFYPRDQDFFREMGYPDKKPTLVYKVQRIGLISGWPEKPSPMTLSPIPIAPMTSRPIPEPAAQSSG